MTSYTLTVDEDGMLTLPEEVITEVGWKVGDSLIWIDNKDGSWSLIKEPLTSMILDYTLNNKDENR